jgi:GNAT superfamily N-acetyltransferase
VFDKRILEAKSPGIRTMKKLTGPGVDSEGDLPSHTKHGRQPTARFLIRELRRETWPDFARFFENRPPVWSGCWCVAFHMKPGESPGKAAENRALKERLVRADRSHAALVYDGGDVVGWCQFGPPAELPARMRGYGKLDAALPDWRITCFFVDRQRRGEGIAKTALQGVLRIIATKGGGTVDGYPIVIPRGKPYSNNFLWSGAESMFAKLGFRRLGNLGSSKLAMRKVVRSR